MRLRLLTFLSLVACTAPTGWQLSAQQPNPQVPEFTSEQRWGRLAYIDLYRIEKTVALGRLRGMSLDQIGTWLGNDFASTYVGGLDVRQLALNFRWNHLSHPNGKVEIVQFSDTLVVARFNTPVLATFGADRKFATLSLDDYNTLFMRVNEVIAERVGISLEQRLDGDWLVTTMRNRYQLPNASESLRWGRAAFHVKLFVIEALRMAKVGGKSATEAGRDAARTYADTWSGTDTPWRLFRNWTWNHQTDPNFVCDVQVATPTSVKARCNRPWVGMVRDYLARSKVSVEEYDAYILAMEQGIAESLGMTWEVHMDGEYRIITVQRKR